MNDWDALATALSAQPDVDGNRSDGWDRSLECDDGLFLPLATIGAQPGGRRVSVLYKTAGLAESGRAWFDALAGASATFLLQEMSEPKGMLAHAGAAAGLAEPPAWLMDKDKDTDAPSASRGRAGGIQRMNATLHDCWSEAASGSRLLPDGRAAR